METQYFIGIDISKESLNWAVCSANKIILEQVSGNDIKSITKTVISLQRQLNFKLGSAVFCMEYTGIYHTRLLKYLLSRKAAIWLESGSQTAAAARQIFYGRCQRKERCGGCPTHSSLCLQES